MQTSVDDAIRIHVTSRRALGEKLEVAVQQLQAVAMRTRTHGILVMRHEPGGVHGQAVRPGAFWNHNGTDLLIEDGREQYVSERRMEKSRRVHNEVRHDGHRLRNGVVEEVSSDSSIVWLQLDGVYGRQLIMKTAPYGIYILN